MKPSTFLPFVCASLLLACGQDDVTTAQAEAESELNSLQDRVAAITGRAYTAPAEAAVPAQYVQDQQVAGPGISNAGPTQQAVQETGGVRTVTIPSKDFNMPMSQMDFPARWKVQSYDNGAWKVDEPTLKVWDVSGGNYAFGNGQMAQLYQQSGGAIRTPLSPEQVVLQDAVPRMRKLGYELIGQSDAPAVAQAEQRGLDGLYSVGQSRKTSRANMSEWHKGDLRVALVMHWSSFEGPDMGNWSYYFTRLETSADRFDQEKTALLTGLASLRYNPNYFAAYARSEQQKEQQSWGAHDAKMRTNQAAFDAQQQAHRSNVDAMNNSIMGTWKSTNDRMDHQQNTTINSIRGEEDVINPYTGETYKVESGSDQYWMNSNGEYIGTNDVMFDPNAVEQGVDQWRQAPPKP